MSRRDFLLSLLLIYLVCLFLPAPRFAQQSNPPVKNSPPPKSGEPSVQTNEQDNVVRISTQLVQIDAVVTDRKGNHVDDLKEEEFELLVDGKKQPLTLFSLTNLKREPATSADLLKEAKTPKSAAPTSMPTRNLAPENVARTIAFVVDDLGLSFESTAYTRDALKKFVSQQMQEGDLVGIIRTGRGLGALQQFTSDKRILYAAIDKLTWNPISRDMIPRFGVNDPGAVPGEDEAARQSRQDAQNRFNEFRDTVFSVGTLGAINFVVRGLRELPGRKMVVLVSDGFQLFGSGRDNTQVLDNMRRLVDLANRSSVVIYSLDAKGLQVTGPTAADDLSQMSQQQINERYSQQSKALFDSQEGLTYLARETGGFAVLNNNDLSLGINRVLKDNESYYLLGFDPEDANFDRKFHALKVRVTRSGVQVRSRAGFLGVVDSAPRQPLAGAKTRDEQILATLYSPFGARDLSLRMTSFFFNLEQPAATPAPNTSQARPQAKPQNEKDNKMPPGTLSFVRSYFHIDADKLTFANLADGKKELKLELVAFAFNEAGLVVDQHGRAFSVTLDEARFKTVLAQGFFYAADIPIKRPGAYQFRAVLRDPVSGKVGSAGQFLQVPDLKNKRLAMSGLVLTGEALSAAATSAGPAGQIAAAPETPAQKNDWEFSVALRRFPRNVRLIYGFHIYNATPNAAKQPELSMQVELYQEGKRVFQGQPRPMQFSENSDLKRLDCLGQLALNGFDPGDYLLHVIVTDKSAKQKYAQVDQWMDFSVR